MLFLLILDCVFVTWDGTFCIWDGVSDNHKNMRICICILWINFDQSSPFTFSANLSDQIFFESWLILLMRWYVSTWRWMGQSQATYNRQLPAILKLFRSLQLSKFLLCLLPDKSWEVSKALVDMFNKSCPKHLRICHISWVESLLRALSKSAKFAKNSTTYL